MKYVVYIKEIYETAIEVEAENRDEAVVKAGEAVEYGMDACPEYSTTLDSEKWIIYNKDKDKYE